LAKKAEESSAIDAVATQSQRVKVVVSLKIAAQAVEWLAAVGIT